MTDHETDDDYKYTVRVFDDKWRLVVGPVYGSAYYPDHNQWILQEKLGKKWSGRKYFARASHVSRGARELVGSQAAAWVDNWAAQVHLKHT